MPRGMHPNSRKALEENRANTQFRSSDRGEKSVERVRKANETKARRRTFREEFEAELEAMVKDRNGNETTVKNAITKAIVQKAIRGDQRSAEFIRDTIGEKPVDTVEVRHADFSILDSLDMNNEQAGKS